MKHRCIHCGQVSEVEDPRAQRFTCSACGKNSWVSETTPVTEGQAASASRFRFRDFAIGVLAALALCVLAFLFFRRDQPLHQLVFGQLRGPAPVPVATTTTASQNLNSSSLAAPKPPSEGGSSPPRSDDFHGLPTPSPAPSGPGNGVASVDAVSGGGVVINPATGTPVPPSGTEDFHSPNPGQTGGGTVPASSGTPASGGAANVGQGRTPGSGQGAGSAQTGRLQSPSVTGAAAGPNSAATPGSGISQPQTTAGPRPGSSGAPSVAGTASGSPGASSATAPTSPTRTTPATYASAAPRTSPQAAPASAPRTTQAGTSTSSETSSASPSTTPNQVANEGANELLQLAKKDDATPPDSAQSGQPTPKTAAAGAVPTPEQLASLANPDATTTSAAPSGGTGGALAGKTPEEKQPKPQSERPFDPHGGSNIVFVLDHSLSMKGEKSNVARRELVQTLEKLGPDKTFYVFFFPDKAMPAPGPLPATPENVQAMATWIHSVGHSLGSDPTKAMLKALDLRPDTIWLLSDGKFSDEVPGTLKLANENIHSQINTVGFYSHNGERILKQIADENHGTYRFIAPPSKPSALEPAPTVGGSQPATPP